MAPDLNSLPPSPYSPRHIPSNSSHRATDILPHPESPSSPTTTSRNASTLQPTGDNTGVGVGPGPIRHPRPLTAADLHMQLEKEQEAVVNRLTRELSLLRAQSASVASTTSSTSTGLADYTDQSAHHLVSGLSHPTATRRHRSSSSHSTRSGNTGLAGATASSMSTAGGVAGSTVSGVAPPRDTVAPYSLSRQSSVASRRSEASSPSLSSSLYQGDHFPNLYTHRHTSSASYTQPSSMQATPGSARSSYVSATPRYEEVAHQRSELEAVKRENETLRRRVRELERRVSGRGDGGDGVERSEI